MVEHHAQQILVELEGVGELLHHLRNEMRICNILAKLCPKTFATGTTPKLSHHLPNAVNKLKEDGTSVCIVVLVVSMPCTLGKLVPKAQPLFLNQNLLVLLEY